MSLVQDNTIFTPSLVIEDSRGHHLASEVSHIYRGTLHGKLV